MKARDLMTSPAITVTADTAIRELAAIMRQNRISGVPVVDEDGKLLGIVTEMHLIARNAPIIGPNYISLLSGLIPIDLQQHRRYHEQVRQVLATTAGELMAEQVKFVTPNADLGTMMGLMERPEIIQLPVVDEERVVGVVTRTDLVRLIEKTGDDARHARNNNRKPKDPAPMTDFFVASSAIMQALIATLFTWGVTALGASIVFTTRTFNQRVLDWMLGFAAGVMIAASFWSLLAPAIELSENMGVPSWFPALVGFLLGGVCLRGIDMILPHLHIGAPRAEAEGIETTWQRSILLVLAITLHNIPEGLAVGVAFGAVAVGLDSASLSGAIALAIGIGLQNFPEGVAVAMPLRREGMSPLKSFWYGQLSAVVEPFAGVIGAAAVLFARPLLPYALSFAAGAMIFVVVEEVIPESHRGGNADLATMGTMIGFAAMMVLDVALG